MKQLNEIIGENLTYLRKKAGFTQLEFGEKFSYSDKTVSKWEQGSILPSVDVLKDIADFYGVSVDYLLSEHNNEKDFNSIIKKTPNFNQKAIIVALVITFILIIATVIYVTGIHKLHGVTDPSKNLYWLAFVWCLPPSFLILAYTSSHIFKSKLLALVFSSLFVWTTLAGSYVSALKEGNYWYLFAVGLPIQVALILIYKLRTNNQN